MKNLFFILLSLLVFSSCEVLISAENAKVDVNGGETETDLDSSDTEDSEESEQESEEGLAGTSWSTACIIDGSQSYILKLEFYEDGTASFDQKLFTDLNCINKYETWGQVFDYSEVSTSKISFSRFKFTLVGESQSIIDQNISDTYCEISTWEINVVEDITGLWCVDDITYTDFNVSYTINSNDQLIFQSITELVALRSMDNAPFSKD